ncbi:unnamed protein product, partial [Tenebrio molitor]
MTKTGTGKKEPPPHFAQLHSILGETDKINPKNVIDSIEAETSEISEPENEDKRDQIKNRFKNAKKMTKPKSSNEQLLHFLEKQHDHD